LRGEPGPRIRRGAHRRWGGEAARDAGTDLGEQLVADGLLTKEEVAAATDPTQALGAVGAFVDRVTGA